MRLLNIGSFQLLDHITGELSYVGVRVADNYVGLTLVQKESGEPEVFLSIEESQRLITLLTTAINECTTNK